MASAAAWRMRQRRRRQLPTAAPPESHRPESHVLAGNSTGQVTAKRDSAVTVRFYPSRRCL